MEICCPGTDTAMLLAESDSAVKGSSCCGTESKSQSVESGCCSDSDTCCIDCAPTSKVVVIETVSASNSSCC